MKNYDMTPKKILLIRMLGLGDVTCIGVPALRYFKHRFPEAEFTFLTFSAGQEVIRLAEPDVDIIGLEKDQWPDNIIPAMETFMGLAEKIVSREFTQIVNLDTWFMPCFLTRFLKDAGESVIGNYMSCSVQELLDQFQQQTLEPQYVNDPACYMQSTFFCMERWHQPWWTADHLPAGGYPEFYLRSCCSFELHDLDTQIEVEADVVLSAIRKEKKVIALAPDTRTPERSYPYGAELKTLLENAGYYVWGGFDGSESLEKTLGKLKSTDLLVTAPSAPQWLAASVSCPSLVISSNVDPRTLMPDYATDVNGVCPAHGAFETSVSRQEQCLCVKPGSLLESIDSIFTDVS